MTTICSVKYNGQTAIAGDGQVTLGKSIIAKTTAKKIRRIYHDQVVIGFAGGVADAVSLQEMLEGKLESYSGDLRRAAVEMAQSWRKDPALQHCQYPDRRCRCRAAEGQGRDRLFCCCHPAWAWG